MKAQWKSLLTPGVIALFLFGFALWGLVKPSAQISQSERRMLAQAPEFSLSTVMDGSFMTKFEDYSTDQFPLREEFRALKSFTALKVLRQLDTNGLYVSDGYLSKMEYPLHEDSLKKAAEKFQSLCTSYLDSSNSVYFALIPDKNCYLAEETGHLGVPFEEFENVLKPETSFAQWIDLSDCLMLSDYYRTDTHWRQEKLLNTAQKLAEAMEVSFSPEFTQKTLTESFRGVYAGQLALPEQGEALYYLTNENLEDCRVTDAETGKTGGIYDFQKGQGNDPYEFFLSGSKSLLTITNPNAKTDRRLIVFRDSFGSSLIPLLAESYGEIVLIDIRYLPSQTLGRFVDFENADVLFLYSTLVLNNSETLK